MEWRNKIIKITQLVLEGAERGIDRKICDAEAKDIYHDCLLEIAKILGVEEQFYNIEDKN